MFCDLLNNVDNTLTEYPRVCSLFSRGKIEFSIDDSRPPGSVLMLFVAENLQ